MSERNTVLRSMHDIGLAGWFGGSLMGAVGLNGAAGQAPSPAERLQIASRAGIGGVLSTSPRSVPTWSERRESWCSMRPAWPPGRRWVR